MAKQVVFIGSSSEALQLAKTLGILLKNDRRLDGFEFRVWTEEFEKDMRSPSAVLSDLLQTVSMAILIFTADDVTSMRGRTLNSVRDNLLFEFGLFWGKLGLARTRVLVEDRALVDLPSDIKELTYMVFRLPAAEAGAEQFARMKSAMEEPSMRLVDWLSNCPGGGDLPPTLARLAVNWRKTRDADFQLYSFAGLVSGLERAPDDGRFNLEAIYYLWADAAAGSWIKASISKPDLLRLTFCNRGGSPGNVALRLNKRRVPVAPEGGAFTRLRFDARVPADWQERLAQEAEPAGVQRLDRVALALRLVDSMQTHWKLCCHINAEYVLYGVGPCPGEPAWTSFDIDLNDKGHAWCLFRSDGNYQYADAVPDFRHILAVVLELGMELPGADRPGPGMGVIELRGMQAL